MSTEPKMAENVPTAVALPDAAKASVGACSLPTGFIDEDGALHKDAVVKEFTGEEEDILTSKRLQGYQKMEKILENCTVSIGTVTAKGNPDWARVIQGLTVTDRLFLLIQIRMVTLGNAYTFKTQCTNARCNAIQEKVVDLAEFHIHGMPKPELRAWTGTLPSGKAYRAKVQTGAEEEKIAKAALANKDNLSLAMMARLIELDGKMPVTLDMIKKLGATDRNHLRDDFKKHEGLLDNLVEVSCNECGHEFKTAIEVAQENFFFPSGT